MSEKQHNISIYMEPKFHLKVNSVHRVKAAQLFNKLKDFLKLKISAKTMA